MSRLNEALEMLSLGRAPAPSELVDVVGRIECLANGYAPREMWRFSARLSVDTVLPRDTDTKILDLVRRDMVQQISQYVFGEFYEPLMCLRKRAYEAGDSKMVNGVNEIIDKMFGGTRE